VTIYTKSTELSSKWFSNFLKLDLAVEHLVFQSWRTPGKLSQYQCC